MEKDSEQPESAGAVSSTRLLGQSETWFSYDPGDGFEPHDTETAARERAEKALGYYKDEAAGEGWNEEVTQVCWGKVAQQVEETSRKRRPPANELDCGVDKDGTSWGEWDEIVEYDLCPNQERSAMSRTHECEYDSDGGGCRICGKTVAEQLGSFAEPTGYAAALDKSESEWKEATAMAEAWCQEIDPYKRDRAIYCYRAGYLKAKRHTAERSNPAPKI